MYPLFLSQPYLVEDSHVRELFHCGLAGPWWHEGSLQVLSEVRDRGQDQDHIQRWGHRSPGAPLPGIRHVDVVEELRLEELGCTVSNLFLPRTHLPPASGFVLLRAYLQIPRCPRSAFCSFHLHSCACVLPFLQDHRSTQNTYPKPLHGALTHDSRS